MVGGYRYPEVLASSETVTYSTESMAAWTLHTASLLPARAGLRAARMDGVVYVSGGYDDGVYYSAHWLDLVVRVLLFRLLFYTKM